VQLLRGGGKGDALAVKEAVKSGKCQVVVGTHALLQPSVSFESLGLLVIDEEQRFGVAHKEKLKAACGGTDVLTLSATPIPRTLQMSLTGLRDFSLMNSPPAGRKEVVVHVGADEDQVIISAICKEIDRGGQVFVVVPFVSEVEPTCNRLEALIEGITIIEAHGRHDDLEDRIDAFTRKEADILVSTTVIENGIDMPNVNTIIVLSANRFGMSSLYQLRGRVGRSRSQAYAYFMTNSTSLSIEAETRLMYLKTLTALGSGYDLSRRDMEMRGYGTIFGTDQSGAKDVGLDLQAAILKNAVDSLKSELIIAVPDCRIDLGLPIERVFNSHIGPLPPRGDLNAVARWEALLVQNILRKYSKDIETAVEAVSITALVPDELLTTETKKRRGSKTTKETRAYATETLIRDYLSAGSQEAVMTLLNKWDSKFHGVCLPHYSLCMCANQ
jgi:transcription-repair coupling factor (superfamily II helicase)